MDLHLIHGRTQGGGGGGGGGSMGSKDTPPPSPNEVTIALKVFFD